MRDSYTLKDYSRSLLAGQLPYAVRRQMHAIFTMFLVRTFRLISCFMLALCTWELVEWSVLRGSCLDIAPSCSW
jgi:hypothetical protein